AGAAEGQVADADHRHRRPLAPFPAGVVEAIAQPDDPAVGHARRPQAAPLHGGPDAGGPSVDQCPVVVAGCAQERVIVRLLSRRTTRACYSPRRVFLSTEIPAHRLRFCSTVNGRMIPLGMAEGVVEWRFPGGPGADAGGTAPTESVTGCLFSPAGIRFAFPASRNSPTAKGRAWRCRGRTSCSGRRIRGHHLAAHHSLALFFSLGGATPPWTRRGQFFFTRAFMLATTS